MEEHNSMVDHGEHTYRLRMNWFSDVTNGEYLPDVFYRLQVGSLMKLYNSSISAMKVVVLEVIIEILATVNEDDITRWID
ncbi:hypothetical protein ZIOFF_073397 [Zingiber officinale]|uniref:Uncharacterized protein n=1 Tax=Zingiber officinale TaxID=94328 RepID=A0A8J5ESP4_ZINOF|nr:hypothetical protein ZIOFF_073397 [Zingiber officinale]